MCDPTARLGHIDKYLRVASVICFLSIMPASAWGQVIHEESKLLSNDGAAGDWLGRSVAIDGGTIAVGAFFDDDQGVASGSAYLFNASSGTQLRKVVAGDGEQLDYFGSAVAVDTSSEPSVLAVGAPGDDVEFIDDVGSVYLFDALTGVQLHKLLASDRARGDAFGSSVAIDTGVVVVGMPNDGDFGADFGAAYLFDASTGEQVAKLLPDDGSSFLLFGASVAIDSGIVAVGSPLAQAAGAVYLFDAETGAQLRRLAASDGARGDSFGFSVTLEDGIVAVGAPNDEDFGTQTGAVYLYDAATGDEIVKLVASDGRPRDEFGKSVSMADGLIAVGVPGDEDNGNNSGSVYVYEVPTGVLVGKLLPSDGMEDDKCGNSVDLHDGVAAVGAYHDTNENGQVAGAAYAFNVGGARCAADLTEDGVVNTQDFLFFLNAWAAHDPIADWDGNDIIDTRDFIAYLNDWVAGCP